jgi:hypothetical protein
MKKVGVLFAITCSVCLGGLGERLNGQGLDRFESGYLTPLKFQTGEAQFGNWKISASSLPRESGEV